jgi:amidase
VPLMPSYDTVGWFARDATRLAEIGAVLLGQAAEHTARFSRLLILDDAHAEAEEPAVQALHAAEARLMALFPKSAPISLASAGLESWRTAFRTYSAAEAWRVHGDWIESATPNFAPAIANRFAWAESVTPSDAAAAGAAVKAIAAQICAAVGDDTCLVLPSAPGAAPRIDAADQDVELFRQRAQRLTCIASIAGLPQVSIPAGTVDGCPIGLSIIGPPDADLHLLELCASF